MQLTSDRRMGVEGSETWSLLLDTAERIMREKGYAAVSSRLLGREANLSPQIVYFYFRTMDDLFEALFNRVASGLLRSIEAARTAPRPLLELWAISCDPTRSAVMIELLSLSNHRKGLKELIGNFGREYNALQAAIVELECRNRGLDPAKYPPVVVASILENMARGFAFAQTLDISSHEAARNFVTDYLEAHFGG